MKNLSLEQMEKVEGGCSGNQEKAMAIIGLVAGIGASFGPVGLAIAGPTAFGIAIGAVFCAFN